MLTHGRMDGHANMTSRFSQFSKRAQKIRAVCCFDSVSAVNRSVLNNEDTLHLISSFLGAFAKLRKAN
jgi:hypothetical protein